MCLLSANFNFIIIVSGQSYITKKKKKRGNSYDEMLSTVRLELKQKYRKYNIEGLYVLTTWYFTTNIDML